MSWREVARRDAVSVSRARTGPAVAALVALFTVVPVGLMALAADVAMVAAVGGVLTVGALLGMVFFGTPRSIAAVVVAFTGLALLWTAAIATPQNPPDMGSAVVMVGGGLALVVPIVAMLASYAAIVGERTTGSVRFLFGLPNSRQGAYAGKYLSRAAVVCVPLVVGLLLAGVVVGASFENGSFLGMVGVLTVTLPYALLFVGLGLAASAWADSDNLAVAVVVSVYALLRVGWPSAQWLALELWAENQFDRPAWYFWLGRVNPMNAYARLTTEFLPDGPRHPLITVPDEGVAPVATSAEFALVVVIVWAVLAPLVGLGYVRRRDFL
jgi:ABC-2 type transport system permease protein